MDFGIDDYLKVTYQKIKQLKSDDKGEVWLALDDSGRMVILKRTTYLGSPYLILKNKKFSLIPRILQCFNDNREIVVTEEYINGESLLDRVARKAYLTEAEVRNIILQICDGLALIHAEGIIHRDIKPSNRILQAGNIIRLIDFDAARIIKEHGNEDTMRLGTKGYAPPEQFGYGQTDARSDIYSLGITLQKVMPPNYKDYLTKIFTKCTAIDPKQRYQNLQELRRAVIFGNTWHKWGRITVCGIFTSLFCIVGVNVGKENISTEIAPKESIHAQNIDELPNSKIIENTQNESKTPNIKEMTPKSNIIVKQENPLQIVDKEKIFAPINEHATEKILQKEVEKNVYQPQDTAKAEKNFSIQELLSDENIKKAETTDFKRKQHEEFKGRIKLFLEHLPSDMSPEEKKACV